MNISTENIYYENSCGESRRFYAVWHSELGVVCLSFYNEDKCDELVLAEDFCLETAIKMRDELTKLISKISEPAEASSDLKQVNAPVTNLCEKE